MSRSQSIIGGLISSTLLTLVDVPVMLTYLEQLSGLFRKAVAASSPAGS